MPMIIEISLVTEAVIEAIGRVEDARLLAWLAALL